MCPPGTFEQNSTCVPCPDGSSCSSGALHGPCPAGKYMPPRPLDASLAAVHRTDVCIPCQPGRFSTAGATSCSACPAGSSSGFGRSFCEPCDVGLTSVEGGVCESCPSGRFSSTADGTCEACADGMRADTIGAQVCTV